MALENTPAAAESALYISETAAPARTPLTVGDRDDNGIEDWQEPFLTAAPVLLNTSTTDYVRDNTVTEQVSISLMEGILTSRTMGNGSDPLPKDVLLQQSTRQALASTQDRVYSEGDISIINDQDPALVREYANAVANILSTNNIPSLRNEVLILEDATKTKDTKYFDQLRQKGDAFAKNRDMLLTLPVPTNLAKEHLALITSFNILSNNLYAMTEIESDPLKSLLRIRRHQEDGAALAFTMQAIYLKLAKYPTLFTNDDPALIFSLYSDVQRQAI